MLCQGGFEFVKRPLHQHLMHLANTVSVRIKRKIGREPLTTFVAKVAGESASLGSPYYGIATMATRRKRYETFNAEPAVSFFQLPSKPLLLRICHPSPQIVKELFHRRLLGL
jgi:hypothetical protein